jgi:hypothetical protein
MVFEDIGKKILSRLTEGDHQVHLGHLFCDKPDLEGLTLDDMCEKVGAKWAYLTEADDFSMSFYSAWSAITPFVEQYVMPKVAEVDPNAVFVYSYEDEMPNFIGAYVYEGCELIDGEECDGDEILEFIVSETPELEGKWDADEYEWADEESEELFEEVRWESTHELSDRIIETAKGSL